MRKLKILRAQVEFARQQVENLLQAYRTPMARFVTDQLDWVIEVEHLEATGERGFRELLAAAEIEGEFLVFHLDGTTGHSGGNQFYLKGLRNGTYARYVTIRNRGALNVF